MCIDIMYTDYSDTKYFGPYYSRLLCLYLNDPFEIICKRYHVSNMGNNAHLKIY